MKIRFPPLIPTIYALTLIPAITVYPLLEALLASRAGYYGVSILDAIVFYLLFFALPAVTALLILPLVLFFFQKTRVTAKGLLLYISGMILAIILGLVFGHEARRIGFHRLAEKSQFVIAAVDRYIQDKGEAPYTLNYLVPKYLERIPTTGYPCWPDYDLARFNENDRHVFEIEIHPYGTGGEFWYFSNKKWKYADRALFDSYYELNGDWIYFHNDNFDRWMVLQWRDLRRQYPLARTVDQWINTHTYFRTPDTDLEP